MTGNAESAKESVTVVARRRVRPSDAEEFEAHLREFVTWVLGWPGHRGIVVLRPAGAHDEYTVVSHFADLASRRAFTAADAYREWMDRLGARTQGPAEIAEITGVEVWLDRPGTPDARRPPRSKTAVATLLGVYPTSLALSTTLGPRVASWPTPLANLVIAAAMVVALTYVVMPLVTLALRRWLFPDPSPHRSPR